MMPRRRVDPRGQAGRDGDEYDDVHDPGRAGHPEPVQYRHVRALRDPGVVPGQQGHHDQDRADVEDQDAPYHAVHSPADRVIPRRTECTGSVDSPAAMVTTSVPKKEKKTTSEDSATASNPFGRNP